MTDVNALRALLIEVEAMPVELRERPRKIGGGYWLRVTTPDRRHADALVERAQSLVEQIIRPNPCEVNLRFWATPAQVGGMPKRELEP